MKMYAWFFALILSAATVAQEVPTIGQLTPKGTSNSADQDMYQFLVTQAPTKTTNADGKRVLTWELSDSLLSAQGIHVAHGALSVTEDKVTSFTLSAKNNSKHARHMQGWEISAYLPKGTNYPKSAKFGCAQYSLKPGTGGFLTNLPGTVKLVYTQEQLAGGNAMSWPALFDMYWSGKGEHYVYVQLDVYRTDQPMAPRNCLKA